MSDDDRVWWDMVLEWDEGCHHDNCREQKLGFKHRDSFLSATREANRLRISLARACSVPLASCRLVYIGKAAALEKYLTVQAAYLKRRQAEEAKIIKQLVKGSKKLKSKKSSAVVKTKVVRDPSEIRTFRVRDQK